MTRPDLERLRQCYRHASVRELLVHPRGFALNPQHALVPRIEARILSHGAARTRYVRRQVRCRSLDTLTALAAPQRRCTQCPQRHQCTAQLRLDLIVERHPWRLLLEHTSAKRFRDYHAHLNQRAIALEDIVHHIAVINRGSWGELRFSNSPEP